MLVDWWEEYTHNINLFLSFILIVSQHENTSILLEIVAIWGGSVVAVHIHTTHTSHHCDLFLTPEHKNSTYLSVCLPSDLIENKTRDNKMLCTLANLPLFIWKLGGDGWMEWVFFISILFSLPHIRTWQLSHEQAGTCISANERQWVCTLITFQQPLEKKPEREWRREGASEKETGARGEHRTDFLFFF